uniref:TLDc domain-containing protein n=1 Tax=Timema poppense TaxID=170557 RepID=A0A7R9DFP1_TIMPO|nr:unnamed protein product [Timema poppensis]
MPKTLGTGAGIEIMEQSKNLQHLPWGLHHSPDRLTLEPRHLPWGLHHPPDRLTLDESPCRLFQLFALWSWLPVRITMYQPRLLYTTEEHGCSLTTFYVRVEMYEPTLLMIKTCNNEVFGAYCSSRWYERNLKDDHGNRQAYFGTGESFLFSLYPERAKYPWVGIDSSQDDPSLGHSAELFMAADTKMLTIGGGEGQAIWMDENIRFGKTDHCVTFNNPPLCESGDFEIRVLEVYGRHFSHRILNKTFNCEQNITGVFDTTLTKQGVASSVRSIVVRKVTTARCSFAASHYLNQELG